MKAFILIQTQPGTDGRLAREVSQIPGVKRVERVKGPYDLIAEAEWGEAATLEVVPTIQELSGVLRVLTSLVLDGSEPKRPVSWQQQEVPARGA